jgi:pimeloyl-ACP methyl ester carboxylesterase
VHADVPDEIDPDAHYLLYLHGAIVEGQGDGAVHPTYGAYRYGDVLEALAAHGLVVIGQVRSADTAIGPYSRTVADQVERLLAAGVPPHRVTVAGHSKGGLIAAQVASLLGNPEIRFALLAACGRWMDDPDGHRLSGRVLSMYDASDALVTSCRPALDRATEGSSGHEIVLDLGGGHGVFYRPHPEWVDPLVDWATTDQVGADP